MSIFDELSYVQDVNSTNLEAGNERLREKLSSSENKFNFSCLSSSTQGTLLRNQVFLTL